MTQTSFPVILTRLSNCVVIGGGRVAERKVRALLAGGVNPTVISPELTPGLYSLKEQGKIQHLARNCLAGDLGGAQLAIIATDDPQVNAQAAREAAGRGILCNVVDDPDGSSFHTVGAVRRGSLLLTVSSGGESPALTRHLRRKLERSYPAAYQSLLEMLKEHRSGLASLTEKAREEVLEELTTPGVLEQLVNDPEAMGRRLSELIEQWREAAAG